MLYVLHLFFTLYIVLYRQYFQYFARYGFGLYTTILQRGGRISSSKSNIVILMRNVLIVVEQGLKMTMRVQKESLNA